MRHHIPVRLRYGYGYTRKRMCCAPPWVIHGIHIARFLPLTRVLTPLSLQPPFLFPYFSSSHSTIYFLLLRTFSSRSLLLNAPPFFRPRGARKERCEEDMFCARGCRFFREHFLDIRDALRKIKASQQKSIREFDTLKE